MMNTHLILKSQSLKLLSGDKWGLYVNRHVCCTQIVYHKTFNWMKCKNTANLHCQLRKRRKAHTVLTRLLARAKWISSSLLSKHLRCLYTFFVVWGFHASPSFSQFFSKGMEGLFVSLLGDRHKYLLRILNFSLFLPISRS